MTDTTQPAQSWVTDSTYQSLRDQLLLANEGNRSRLYFDTRGIPTIGDGIALVVKNNLLNKWVVDTGAVGALGDGISTADRANLQQAADILNGTRSDEPQYGTKKTLTCFELSTRGTQVEMQFGALDSRWQPSGWNLQPDAATMQRLRIYKAAERESRLNVLLSERPDIKDISLTASQRAGLLSMVWQGREDAAIAAARAIKAGESYQQICSAAANASTGVTAGRFNLECSALTNGEITQYYQPQTTKPLLKSDIDGIVEEMMPFPITASADSGFDAQLSALLQRRTTLKNTLTELASNYEGEVLGFVVTDDGLVLFNDNVTLEARFDGSTIAADASGLVTIAHTVNGKRLTITWDESPEGGGREAITILVDGQMVSNKAALAALGGYGDELEAVTNGAQDALLVQVADGNTTLTQTDAVGSVITTLDASGHVVQTVTHNISGHSVQVEFVEDEWGDLKASRVITVDGKAPTNGDAFVNALNNQGYDSWDFADDQTPAGGSDLGSIYNTFDPLSLPANTPPPPTITNEPTDQQKLYALINFLQAIKSGEPLPIASAGVNLAAVFGNAPSLTAAGSLLGSAASLLAFEKNLQNHDYIKALLAGAQLIQNGATAYAALGLSRLDGAGQTLAQALKDGAFGNATELIAGINTWLPVLGAIYSLTRNDATGAMLSIIAIEFPPIILLAPILGKVLVERTNDTGYDRFGWNNAGGTITYGNGTGAGMLNSFNAEILQPFIANAKIISPQSPLGLVASRLPGINYQNGIISPDNFRNVDGSDNTAARLFDNAGNRINATVGSDEYFSNLRQELLFDTLRHYAIAPAWEVATAWMQWLNNPPDLSGNPYAFDSGLPRGQTELDYSGAAQPNTPVSFKPITLDLNGDGKISILEEHSVAFDVNDSGFLRNTKWVGPNDGFLVLDKNNNGMIDGGNELFSNGQVPTNMRVRFKLMWSKIGQINQC